MRNTLFKKVVKILPFFAFLVFILPNSTFAYNKGGYADLRVYVKFTYPSGNSINASGVDVKVSNNNNSTATYTGSCDASSSGTRYCRSQGIVSVDSTNGNALTCFDSVTRTTGDDGWARRAFTDASGVLHYWFDDTSANHRIAFAPCHCNYYINLSSIEVPSGYEIDHYEAHGPNTDTYSNTSLPYLTRSAWDNDTNENVNFKIVLKAKPVVTPAATCSISAASSAIDSGGSTTLTFSSSNATSGSINNNVGVVGISGSRSVSPTSTTTYIYNVSGSGGSGSCNTTVSVNSPYIPVTAYPTVSNSSPLNNATLSGDSTKLIGYITLPGYKYSSGDNAYVTLKIAYAGSTTGSQTGVAISDPVRLTNFSNSVQFTIDTSSLDSGKYTWKTFGWISSGNPKDTSGNAFSMSTFSSSTWSFTVPEASQPAPACQVSPSTGDNPLTISISLSNDSIVGPYTIDFADGTTATVNSFSNLPYYHTYNKTGSYLVTIKTSSGTVICTTNVTVSGSTNGNGGEVTP